MGQYITIKKCYSDDITSKKFTDLNHFLFQKLKVNTINSYYKNRNKNFNQKISYFSSRLN